MRECGTFQRCGEGERKCVPGRLATCDAGLGAGGGEALWMFVHVPVCSVGEGLERGAECMTSTQTIYAFLEATFR